MPHSFTLQPSKFEFDDFLKWQSGNGGSWNEDKQNISFFESLKGRLNSLSSPTKINYSLDRRRDGKIDTASRREVLVERDLRFERLIKDKRQERIKREKTTKKPQVKWVTSNAWMQKAGEEGSGRCLACFAIPRGLTNYPLHIWVRNGRDNIFITLDQIYTVLTFYIPFSGGLYLISFVYKTHIWPQIFQNVMIFTTCYG